MNISKIFNSISYLQIPMSITSCYFAFVNDFNGFFIFLGLTLSFATLESKPNNRIDKYIINKPKLHSFSIVFISLIGLSSIFFGLFVFIFNHYIGNEFSTGLIVMGVGYINVVKSRIEIFENNKKTKLTK